MCISEVEDESPVLFLLGLQLFACRLSLRFFLYQPQQGIELMVISGIRFKRHNWNSKGTSPFPFAIEVVF